MSSRLKEDLTATTSRDLESIERRLARLEQAVAAMQDTSALEERLLARVSDRATRSSSTAGVLIEAGRRLLPAAIEPVSAAPGHDPNLERRSWLFIDLYTELRAIFWLFLDRRYQCSWICRLVIPVFLLLFFGSSWFLGSIPLIGWVIDKIFDVAIVIVAYKILSREAARYRLAVPDFPTMRDWNSHRSY
jgi:hypothetical protein